MLQCMCITTPNLSNATVYEYHYTTGNMRGSAPRSESGYESFLLSATESQV
jgi:hypothetical protein